MKVRSRSNPGGIVVPSRIGQRRQHDVAIVKTGKLENPDDILTPGEAEQVREGEAQLRQGL